MVHIVQVRVGEGDSGSTASRNTRCNPSRGLRILLDDRGGNRELSVIAGIGADITVGTLISIDIKVIEDCAHQKQLIQIEIYRR